MKAGRGEPAPPGRVEIHRRWDAAALRTAAVAPRGGPAAVMTWEEPSRVDAGPSPALAGLLGAVLVGFGELAFRFVGPLPAGLRELPRGRPSGQWRHNPSSRNALSRNPWRLVATRAPEAAPLLFEDGWSGGDQVGLAAASQDRCAEILLSTDLSDVALLDGEILFAAVVDGAGALLAAATEARLAEVLGALAAALGDAGFTVDR